MSVIDGGVLALRFLVNLAVDYIERVDMPKRLIIRNFRLGLLLRSIQTVTVLFVFMLVFSRGSYMRTVNPETSVTCWIETIEADYQSKVQEDFQKSFCADPSRYDYIYDASWHYTNFSCTTMPTRERFWKGGSGTNLYIPLSYEETFHEVKEAPSSSATNCSGLATPCAGGWRVQTAPADQSAGTPLLCECISVERFFVAGVQSLALGFEHNYKLPSSGGFERGLMGRADKFSAQSSTTSCMNDRNWECEEKDNMEALRERGELRTVVLMDQGQGKTTFLKAFTSPSSIGLPLQDVFTAAGTSLDDFNLEATENRLRCGLDVSGSPCRDDVQIHPLVRQTGVTIEMNMEYTNTMSHPDIPALTDHDHEGPACIIRIKVVPSWVGRPKTDCFGPGSCRTRYHYGVQVDFSATGEFGYFDFNQLAVTVGSGLVYTVVPVVLISYLAMYCLGPVSNIYYEADKQHMRIHDELTGTTFRILSYVNTFRSLANGKDGLSKSIVLEEVRALFEYTDILSLEKQERLADLIFQKVAKEGSSEILLREFVAACTSNESICMPDLVELFDSDRTRLPPEQLFCAETHVHRIGRPSGRLTRGLSSTPRPLRSAHPI